MTQASPSQSNRQSGMTLLELLVVITILGLLTAAIGTIALNYLGGAKSDTTSLKIDQTMAALDYFRLDMGRYPSEDEGLDALWEAPRGAARWNGPYVQKRDSLVDAWGAQLLYREPGEHGTVDVYSLGSDGAEGGEEEARDVTSW
ncbi:MAG: type II secretion system major pseudopilin GspG [Pseudomonadota bacterium]